MKFSFAILRQFLGALSLISAILGSKYFSLLWGNLKRRKLRTVLTLLTIFIAFMLFALLCIVNAAFTQGVTLAGQKRLLVMNKLTFTELLPVNYKEKIERIEGVERACHWNWFNGIYQDDRTQFFGSFPVAPLDFYDLHPEYEVSPDARAAWESTRNGAIVGPELFRRYEWKLGQVIQLKSPFYFKRDGSNAWEFTIVGVYRVADKAADPISFFFRWDYFNEAREEDNQGLAGWYSVRVRDPKESDRVASAIDAEFENSPFETKSEPEAAFVQGFANQFGNIGLILTWILTAVFFTILIVVGNTMAQSVRERTEEIGVLKALGYSDSRVLILVLAESCLLSLLGGFAGLFLVGLHATLAGSPFPSTFPVWFLPGNDVWLGVALAVGLGIAAGIFPAVVAMRLQTSVALRRQG